MILQARMFISLEKYLYLFFIWFPFITYHFTQ